MPVHQRLLRRVLDRVPWLGSRRHQAVVRTMTRLGRLGARQLRQDRAGQMAAALAFRTLFGLLPLTVVGTLLARGIGGAASFRDSMAGLLSRLGLDGYRVSAIDAIDAIEGGDAAAAPSLADWLLDIVGQAERIGEATLTWVGLAVLAYSAIGLMTTIESSFNTILRASSSRPWRVRVPVYWFVLCLLPAVVALVVWVDTRFGAFLAATEGPRWLIRALSLAWGLSALWVTLMLLYRLVPNTRVSIRAVMTGAATAAILLEAGRRGFGLYIEHAVTLRQLAGTLGLLPLFMIWVYLTWLGILFGLEVAAVTDRLRSGEAADGGPALVDPAAALAVTASVARRFAVGETADLAHVAGDTGLPADAAERLVDGLVAAGILRRVDGGGDDAALVLGRPPEGIDAAEVLAVGQGLAAGGGGGAIAATMEALRAAQRERLSSVTVAGLGAAGRA